MAQKTSLYLKEKVPASIGNELSTAYSEFMMIQNNIGELFPELVNETEEFKSYNHAVNTLILQNNNFAKKIQEYHAWLTGNKIGGIFLRLQKENEILQNKYLLLNKIIRDN
ncbi:unnamed protein product [Blepharisma stoltei]|uniref:Uncharacterized protein n=1 Tax=Blepharisma stoltei TaxID=1481888 RepID=A0AAU9JYY9_9CILI|nr:unnamed protein product [Blepharisma stoltei]